MTTKRNALVSVAVALVGLGTFLRSDSLVALSVPFVAYVVLAGLVGKAPNLNVSAKRESGAGRVFEGGTIEVATVLLNEGGELGLLRAEDRLPRGLRLVSGNNVGFAAMAKGGTLEMRYRLTSDVPGTYKVGPIVLTATDSFGLSSEMSVLRSAFELDVLPRVRQRRSVSFRPRKTGNWPGRVVSPRPGSGQDFYALRQYLPTDSARVINWKAWARLDRMYSNQFMSELGADAAIIVDKSSSSDFGIPPESALTYVERCAAAVSSGLLLAGNRVEMAIVGDMFYRVNPGTGRRQFERILLALVRAKKGRLENLELLPEYLSLWFPRASSIIAISSLGDERIIAPLVRVGARRNLQVISPSFFGEGETKGGARDINEVAGLLVKLQRKARIERLSKYADVVEWNVAVPVETTLERALLRTNRVVAR
jgi:uncharacterized protein (DUF58 family)